MRRTRLVCAALGALSLFAWGGEASAQTIALAQGTTNPNRKHFRSQDLNPLWISRADCLSKDVYTFTVTVSANFNQLGYSLEVWATNAGGDCSTTEARMGANAICWKLGSYSGITSTALDIPITVRDIVGGSAAPPTWQGPGSKDGDDSVCTGTGADTPQPVLLYFLPVQGNTVGAGFVYGTSPTAQIKVDLVPPRAPTTIDLGIGDESLVLRWSQSTSPDVAGYRFFCDPPPGSEGSTPPTSSLDGGLPTMPGCGGASGTAGASGGSSGSPATAGASGGQSCVQPSSACASNVILPGVYADAAYECGSVAGLTATSGSTRSLKNGFTYTVAVAAMDGVGNVGVLSPVACAAPAPIDTFFKVYRDAGGQAGGGFCSTGPVGETVGVGALGLVAALGLVGRLRRRAR